MFDLVHLSLTRPVCFSERLMEVTHCLCKVSPVLFCGAEVCIPSFSACRKILSSWWRRTSWDSPRGIKASPSTCWTPSPRSWASNMRSTRSAANSCFSVDWSVNCQKIVRSFNQRFPKDQDIKSDPNTQFTVEEEENILISEAGVRETVLTL